MKKLQIMILLIFLFGIFNVTGFKFQREGIFYETDDEGMKFSFTDKDKEIYYESSGNEDLEEDNGSEDSVFEYYSPGMKIRIANKNREKIMGTFQERLENCRTENCEDSLRERIERMQNISDDIIDRVWQMEQRRAESIKEWEDLLNKSVFIKFKFENNFNARFIDDIEIENARMRYELAKQRYENAKELYIKERLRFLELKQGKDGCEENCDEIDEELKQAAKDHLLHSADVILEHLTKIKEKINSNEDLSQEEVDELLGKIEGGINEIEDIKERINNAETEDELIELAKELREKLKEIKKLASEVIQIHSNARIGGVIVKSKHLQTKLEDILSKLEEEGIDTSDLQNKIDEFNKLIEEAKEKYEKAQRMLEERNINEITPIIREAKLILREANVVLREIIVEIKAKNPEALEDLSE